MKITDVSLTMSTWELPKDPSKLGNSGLGGHLPPRRSSTEIALVTISTDEGIEGHSFLGTTSYPATFDGPAAIEYLKPILIGKNPLDIGRLWQDMWARTRMYVSIRSVSALDIALWDIAGKAANLPIHRLLGTCRQSIPAYYSGGKPTPEECVNEALECKSKGFIGYKYKGEDTPRELIEKCRALRKAVGDEFILMLALGNSLSYEDALRVGREIEELKYFWYQSPLRADDMYGNIKLARELDIPIGSTGDTPGGFYYLNQWIVQGATDIVNADVEFKGGITALVKICHLAEAFRMKCEIKHTGTSLGDVANLHVQMAIVNCDFYEYISEMWTHFGLVRNVSVDKNGLVHAPEAPGLGYEIDWELLKKNTTQALR